MKTPVRYLSIACFCWTFIALPAFALPLKTLDGLVDEEHRYAIDFLFFSHLAEGDLSLKRTEEPGHYRAVLVARTLGVAAWLTGDRTQSYNSLMRLRDDGRLQSLVHESRIIKRKRRQWRDRGKRYRFDYDLGKVFQEKSRDGHFRPGLEYEIPEESDPVDILAAFYNLRIGTYGPVTPGRLIRIPTFTSKGFTTIDVAVLSPEEQAQQPFFPPGGTLLRVTIDPEVFETGGGDLYVWFDDSGAPRNGLVEDVIGLGDVRGRELIPSGAD